jgi:hypothetical protein
MSYRTRYFEEIRNRFASRQSLSVSEIAVMFSPPLPEDGVRDLATTLRELCEFDLGLARPDDALDLLLVRPSATNPIQWFSHEGTQMNISDELHERFHDRLRQRGVTGKGPRLLTFGELLLAWCGREAPI